MDSAFRCVVVSSVPGRLDGLFPGKILLSVWLGAVGACLKVNIPVVVAAYNRDTALERLLGSLQRARYLDPVKLIISVDGGGPPEVVNVAERFVWVHGEKEVIVQKKNMGLRQHILFCGGLTSLYDGIVLLEDDLYVSPWFYHYAASAALQYRESREVCGIALYAPHLNESGQFPFCPLEDGADVFFMQLACSWGQLWTTSQWAEFASWYVENAESSLENDPVLPCVVRRWPAASWKKYFIKYMIEKDKYFVYPRKSLSTNFGDMGAHHSGTLLFQVPLLYGEGKGFKFSDFVNSPAKYDAFGEILPEVLRDYCPELRGKDFVVDLNGIKEKHCFAAKYVITSKKCYDSISSYGRYLKPIECNVIENIKGDDILFAEAGSIIDLYYDDFISYIYKKFSELEIHKYYYSLPDSHYMLYDKYKFESRKYFEELGQHRAWLKGCMGELEKHKKWIEECKLTVEKKTAEIEKKSAEIEGVLGELAEARNSINLIRNSTSYKIGNVIVRPFSCLIRKRKS